MTYKELLRLNSGLCPINVSVDITQEAIHEPPQYETGNVLPFVVESRLYGDVYLFTDDYIRLCILAFSTDCLLGMTAVSPEFEKILDSYIHWLETSDPGEYPLFMHESLDRELRALVTCANIPNIDDCDGQPLPELPVCT